MKGALRRAAWKRALCIEEQPDTLLSNLRVCCKHFKGGYPSLPHDSTHVDWAPSLYLTKDAVKVNNPLKPLVKLLPYRPLHTTSIVKESFSKIHVKLPVKKSTNNNQVKLPVKDIVHPHIKSTKPPLVYTYSTNKAIQKDGC